MSKPLSLDQIMTNFHADLEKADEMYRKARKRAEDRRQAAMDRAVQAEERRRRERGRLPS